MCNKYLLLKVLLTAIGFAVVFSSVSASHSLNTPDSPNETQLTNHYATLYQPILEDFIRKGHPGVGVLIRTQEEGTWNGTAGFARLEDRTPVRPDHIFNSLSCAKAYTATAIMLLWEEGRIDLDTCIDQYLPNNICDRIANGHSATVRHLLSHTSGIPDSEEKRITVKILNNPYGWAWRDELEAIYDKPALFAAGTNLEYGNNNYILLAVIIDRLTGSHAQFFSTRIFQYLDLSNTYYKLEPGLPRPSKLVNIYFDRYGDGMLENATDEFCALQYNADYGNSGIIADLTDYAQFMESLMDGLIVGPDALETMTAPSFPGFEWRGTGIGILDWTDNRDVVHRFYEMAGSGINGMAQTRYFPLEGVTISCATNVGSTNRPQADEHFYGLLDDLTNAVFNLRSSLHSSEEAKERKNSSKKRFKLGERVKLRID